MKAAPITILCCVITLTISLAQNSSIVTIELPEMVEDEIHKDTFLVVTEPVGGNKLFREKLEAALSEGDTTGRKFPVSLSNIAFFVGKDGVVDSAWVIHHKKPFHNKIIQHLKSTPWTVPLKDGEPKASRQELYIEIRLNKSTLKRHGYWPSLLERFLPL